MNLKSSKNVSLWEVAPSDKDQVFMKVTQIVACEVFRENLQICKLMLFVSTEGNKNE